jgi:exonuclease VII small subunit
MMSFLDKLKVVALRHKRAAESIKQQIEAQGQQIDEKQFLAGYMLPHFETALKDLQSQVFSEFDVEEDELEEAVAYYMKGGNLKLREVK